MAFLPSRTCERHIPNWPVKVTNLNRSLVFLVFLINLIYTIAFFRITQHFRFPQRGLFCLTLLNINPLRESCKILKDSAVGGPSHEFNFHFPLLGSKWHIIKIKVPTDLILFWITANSMISWFLLFSTCSLFVNYRQNVADDVPL